LQQCTDSHVVGANVQGFAVD